MPFIHVYNKIGWHCDVRVASYGFFVTGDGKTALDAHFSYLNFAIKRHVSSPGGKILSAYDLALAISGGFEDQSRIVANTTVIYIEIDERGSCSKTFSIPQIGTRSIHLLEFPNHPETSTSAVAVRVSRLWLAVPHEIRAAELEDFLSSNPFSLRGTIKNRLTSKKECEISSKKGAGSRKIGEATVQDQLTAGVLLEAMAEETVAAKQFYQTDNIVPIPHWMQPYLEEAYPDYAARPQKRRPKLSSAINSKLVKLVSRHFLLLVLVSTDSIIS